MSRRLQNGSSPHIVTLFRRNDPIARLPDELKHVTWEKVKKRIEVDDETGCWIYLGASVWAGGYTYGKENGYGRYGRCSIRVNGNTVRILTHRLAYEMENGPLMQGLVCDHLCNRTLCCNPDHIRQVGYRENVHHEPFPEEDKP